MKGYDIDKQKDKGFVFRITASKVDWIWYRSLKTFFLIRGDRSESVTVTSLADHLRISAIFCV